MAVLWMRSHMARTHLMMRAFRHCNIFDPLLFYQRWVFKVIFQVMGLFGSAHAVSIGAKRYVDALTDSTGTEYRNGVFYASKEGLAGPVTNQNEICDFLSEETYKNNSAAAIQKFL